MTAARRRRPTPGAGGRSADAVPTRGGAADHDEAISDRTGRRRESGEVAAGTREFADGLVRGTVERLADADALIASHARNWRIERMAVLDRLVLRLAIYELLAEPATPAKVVINEALELARTFSGEEAVPFVNGVLDAVRKTLGKE